VSQLQRGGAPAGWVYSTLSRCSSSAVMSQLQTGAGRLPLLPLDSNAAVQNNAVREAEDKPPSNLSERVRSESGRSTTNGEQVRSLLGSMYELPAILLRSGSLFLYTSFFHKYIERDKTEANAPRQAN